MTELETTTTGRVERELDAMRSGVVAGMYSSIVGDDTAARLANFNAVTNSEPVSEYLDQQIDLRHIIIQAADVTDEETGEVSQVPRIILVDAAGRAYHAMSQGLFTSVKNLIAFVGEPTEWTESIPVKITEKRTRKGFRTMTIELI